MLISILIPVYNRKSLVEDSIKSALRQTHKDIEIIIVDNFSLDGTWEVIQKIAQLDQRIRVFQNDENIGPVKNWKRCIDEARGEYGKILWSDDLIAPDFIEKTIPLMSSDSVGFVFSGAINFSNSPKNGVKKYFIGKTGLYPSQLFIEGSLFDKGFPVSPGCALFRIRDLKKNLLTNVENKVGSDFSMHGIGSDLLVFLLTAQQYQNFGFVNEPLSFFRSHDGSISVSSKGGRLPLHYALAKAYFVENYAPQYAPRLAARIQWYLFLYHKNLPFGEGIVEDYFLRQIRIDKVELIKICLRRFLGISLRKFKKIFKRH